MVLHCLCVDDASAVSIWRSLQYRAALLYVLQFSHEQVAVQCVNWEKIHRDTVSYELLHCALQPHCIIRGTDYQQS